MLNAARGLPEHLLRGVALAAEAGRDHTGVREVLVCGMGGSAFPGDLLRVYAEPCGVPVRVSRDYAVRGPVGAETLALVSSFSGDTEETLAALADVLARGARVVAITAGGRLAAEAERLDLPLVRLERPAPDFQPRAATGYFYGAFAAILENAGLLAAARAHVSALAERLAGPNDLEAQAAPIADALRGRIPVVYATEPFVDSAARVIKIKLNENAKTPAFFNGLPELNHNEMVGFTRVPGPFTAVLLRDPDLGAPMRRRLAATADTLRGAGVPCVEVALVSGTDPEKLFSVLQLFDFVSVRLAELDGIDPTPVEMVQEFKRRLS